MKVPYVVALVEKDAVEQVPTTVPAHEVPVLQAVHGGRVAVDENADLPAGLIETEDFDPEDEYARLETRYGDAPGTKASYASIAYGGLQGFIDAMSAAAHDTNGPRSARKAIAKAKANTEE